MKVNDIFERDFEGQKMRFQLIELNHTFEKYANEGEKNGCIRSLAPTDQGLKVKTQDRCRRIVLLPLRTDLRTDLRTQI